MAENLDLMEMHRALPVAVRNRLDRSPSEDLAQSRSQRNGGLPMIQLVYHLLPEQDCRLEPPYLVQTVAEEFDISETAARTKLKTLADNGILDEHETGGHLYEIASDLSVASDSETESRVARPDGGVTPQCDIAATEPATTAATHRADSTGQGYRLSDTCRESVDSPSLIDPSDGTPGAPVAASIALLVLGVVDTTFPATAGLTMSVTWLVYEFAKVPNYTPRETIQVLTENHS